MKKTMKRVPTVLPSTLSCKPLRWIAVQMPWIKQATMKKISTMSVLIVNLPTGPIGATQPTEIRSKSKAKMSKEINMLLNGSPHWILNC